MRKGAVQDCITKWFFDKLRHSAADFSRAVFFAVAFFGHGFAQAWRPADHEPGANHALADLLQLHISNLGASVFLKSAEGQHTVEAVEQFRFKVAAQGGLGELLIIGIFQHILAETDAVGGLGVIGGANI